MSNRRFGCFGFGLVILLAASILLNFLLVAVSSRRFATADLRVAEPQRWQEKQIVKPSGGSGSKIAQIDLRGVISSSVDGLVGQTMVDDIKIALAQAIGDESVKAIVLHIDSPGGEVTASDAIYNAVRDARKTKPIVVYMGSVAASGGYYIACGGTHLMANRTTITGSIGVIIQTLNYEGLFGKIGLDSVVFKSGKFKDILSGTRQMTPEEQEYIQALVMEIYGEFVGIVSRERGLPEEELRSGIADGRIVSGKDAVKAKLIDATGYIEDAYAKARELGDAPDAGVIGYEAKFALGRLFRMLGESGDTKVQVNLTEQILPQLEPGRAYLLPSFLVP
jgi:protease-4